MMTRPMDTHQYAPAPYPQVGYKGAVKTIMVKGVPTTWAVARPTSFPQSPYPAQIPPARYNAFGFNPPRYDLEMDPANPASWQRQYLFT